MRCAVGAFAALILCASAADAAAPQDLWGYHPGQSLAEALSVDAGRVVGKCEIGQATKCISFKIEYLHHDAKVQVEFGPDDHVVRISFGMLNLEQKQFYDCAQMIAAIVGDASRTYGDFTTSDPGKSYVWTDPATRYKLDTFCLRLVPNRPMVGGVSGSLEPVSP